MNKTTRNAFIAAFFIWAILGIIGISLFAFMNKGDSITRKEQSDIIVEQINKVNKLISLEGNFAEVYTLDQTQKLFFDIIPIPKKAIVIAKAKTYVAYDLSKMEYELNEDKKTLTLSNIPEPEIIVDPKLEFYDLKANILPFTKQELSKLNERAIELLRVEANQQGFVELAEENLQLNLEKIMLVAENQGWEVVIEK